MVRSMTGYGRGEVEEYGRRFVVEIKTVNHKYSDISIKLPRQVSFLEKATRELIKEEISRGKTEVFVVYDDFGDDSRTVLVDWPLVDKYVHNCQELRDRYGFEDAVTLSLVTGFPDIFRVEKQEGDEETVTSVFLKAAEQALDGLIKMRKSEGEKLKADIRGNLNTIEYRLMSIENRASVVVDEYRAKLESRLKEVLQQQVVDENRLATECAYFAERCCINEEIVRLKSHIKQMKDTISMAEPVGRKMDFLVQEMNREINTIGSKSSDIEIVKHVVDIKAFIDKIREQVQNIE